MIGPLCTDARMLGLEGSGVASYAAALRRAQRSLDRGSRLLADGGGALTADPADGRARRWLAALWPGARAAAAGQLADGSPAFIGRDLFRLASVWFDVHRRLMPVRVPGAPGIMHWSYPVPLRIVGWHNVYTIHDAIPLVAPALSPIDGARHARLLHRIATAAARLVTVSDAARAEISAALALDPARVVNCGQAVEHSPSGAPLPAGLRPGAYLLMIGTIEPRKNVARVIEAWRRSGTGLPLVLAGRDGWRAAKIEVDRPGVVRLPAVDGRTLGSLVAGARALLMPSLAEGFGLPVIEAMAAGTLVLTSRGGALEETAGGAAVLVDPQDTDAIAAAIRTLSADDALAEGLTAAGMVNARRFTRERFATRLDALYAQLREEAPA